MESVKDQDDGIHESSNEETAASTELVMNIAKSHESRSTELKSLQRSLHDLTVVTNNMNTVRMLSVGTNGADGNLEQDAGSEDKVKSDNLDDSKKNTDAIVGDYQYFLKEVRTIIHLHYLCFQRRFVFFILLISLSFSSIPSTVDNPPY